MTDPLPWRDIPGGVELAVRLTPRGGKSGSDGIAIIDGRARMRSRVAAPPVEGAANAALIVFLSKELGISKSSIIILSGAQARVKRLRLLGDGLPDRLDALRVKKS